MSKEQKPVVTTPEASDQVSGPSIGLLITGILGAALSFIGLIAGLFETGIESIKSNEFIGGYARIAEGAAGVAFCFVGLLVAGFIIYASLKMKALTQWSLCIAASIIAMIPCISPCCIVGLPIGIWCLVVLTKPEVRASFH
ncbi:hypothetical protein LCGC14_1057420 [marine sediment metagenome]|uniref:DUF4064 domain-containing protein n=1 Tax=marine sediment metagenome TaxID=412755 RepID=A0A0F9QT48_9ZZZZ|nr:hypothetical protein [Candidatus Aminicenantes bacterium]HEB35975.1 hypothetical protein [Candidatus Aminicenantes bacterium]